MKHSVKKVIRYIIAFVYPEYCPYCSEVIEPWQISCPHCKKNVLNQSVTIRRGVLGSRCVSPFAYEGRVRKAIVNFKFHDMIQYERPLAEMMAKTIREEYDLSEIDLITYVPMYYRDEFKREYNQSRLLAEELSSIFSIPCAALLKKIKRTKKQHLLKFSERKKNLSGAFAVIDKERIKGKGILLIDDVITSGNTLSHCVKKLYSAKPRQVFCATLASAAERERTTRKLPSKKE